MSFFVFSRLFDPAESDKKGHFLVTFWPVSEPAFGQKCLVLPFEPAKSRPETGSKGGPREHTEYTEYTEYTEK